MPSLFEAFTLRGLELPNRLWVSPMCQYSARDGIVGSWHEVHLGAFATGGAGLVIAEATAVNPKGRISVACPGLWNDAQSEAWSHVVNFNHSQGSRIGIQLAHAGRKGSTMRPWDDHVIAGDRDGGWIAQAPSALEFPGYPVPASLTLGEIDDLVDDFETATSRAVQTGFDMVELHAAHGYLLHQFMSPLSNERNDAYGGSFENRVRLTIRVAERIRATIPDSMPFFVRISATDYVDGGWDLDQSVTLSTQLKSVGVDLIDVSSGGNVHGVRIPLGPGYQVSFATVIGRETAIPVSAVGLITEPQQANEIITSGQADAVMAARAFLRNPRWALHAAEVLGEVVPWPVQYERARTLRP